MLVDHQLIEATITYPAANRCTADYTGPLYFAGKPLVEIPCDLYHGIQNYSPFVFNCKLVTLAEAAAFLATQPEHYEVI